MYYRKQNFENSIVNAFKVNLVATSSLIFSSLHMISKKNAKSDYIIATKQ